MSSSFEELSLGPEVLEALLAEGFEAPSEFQEEIVPVIGRGNNVVGRAGPGAGVLLAYFAPLLDRIDPETGALQVVILVPTRDRADALAGRAARLASRTGHSVAALGGTWALPEGADFLFATPTDLLSAVEGSRVKLGSVQALVVDGGAQIQALQGLDAVETLAEFVPAEAQKILVSLPLTEELDSFVEGHVKRPVHVPPRALSEAPDEETVVPRRGAVGYEIVAEDRTAAALAVVAELLEGDGARHVLIHFHSDDEAADVGDLLSLHGYSAGGPSEADRPVWLGIDPLEARRALEALEEPTDVAILSYRVPLDADQLDQRHGRGGKSVALLRAPELPHLEAIAGVAGYELRPRPDRTAAGLEDQIVGFRKDLEDALVSVDLAPYVLLLEPLLEREGAVRVAAAAAALLRRRGSGPVRQPGGDAAQGVSTRAAEAPPGTPTAWVRLFLSLGSRDGAGPGDVLGAITGEAGVEGSRIGRIDIQDTFSIVEVDREVADRIIRSMNGITVKGRSLRVDYSRSRGEKRRGRAR